jgi:TatD DNase family protein
MLRGMGLSYVDAHLHLADAGYAAQIENIVQNAVENGVAKLLSNGMDYESSIRTVNLAKQYEGLVVAAVGVHPWILTNANEAVNLSA